MGKLNYMFKLNYNIGEIVKKLVFMILLLASQLAFAQENLTKKDDKPDSYYFEQFQDVFKKIQHNYMTVPNRQELVD